MGSSSAPRAEGVPTSHEDRAEPDGTSACVPSQRETEPINVALCQRRPRALPPAEIMGDNGDIDRSSAKTPLAQTFRTTRMSDAGQADGGPEETRLDNGLRQLSKRLFTEDETDGTPQRSKRDECVEPSSCSSKLLRGSPRQECKLEKELCETTAKSEPHTQHVQITSQKNNCKSEPQVASPDGISGADGPQDSGVHREGTTVIDSGTTQRGEVDRATYTGHQGPTSIDDNLEEGPLSTQNKGSTPEGAGQDGTTLGGEANRARTEGPISHADAREAGDSELAYHSANSAEAKPRKDETGSVDRSAAHPCTVSEGGTVDLSTTQNPRQTESTRIRPSSMSSAAVAASIAADTSVGHSERSPGSDYVAASKDLPATRSADEPNPVAKGVAGPCAATPSSGKAEHMLAQPVAGQTAAAPRQGLSTVGSADHENPSSQVPIDEKPTVRATGLHAPGGTTTECSTSERVLGEQQPAGQASVLGSDAANGAQTTRSVSLVAKEEPVELQHKTSTDDTVSDLQKAATDPTETTRTHAQAKAEPSVEMVDRNMPAGQCTSKEAAKDGDPLVAPSRGPTLSESRGEGPVAGASPSAPASVQHETPAHEHDSAFTFSHGHITCCLHHPDHDKYHRSVMVGNVLSIIHDHPHAHSSATVQHLSHPYAPESGSSVTRQRQGIHGCTSARAQGKKRQSQEEHFAAIADAHHRDQTAVEYAATHASFLEHVRAHHNGHIELLRAYHPHLDECANVPSTGAAHDEFSHVPLTSGVQLHGVPNMASSQASAASGTNAGCDSQTTAIASGTTCPTAAHIHGSGKATGDASSLTPVCAATALAAAVSAAGKAPIATGALAASTTAPQGSAASCGLGMSTKALAPVVGAAGVAHANLGHIRHLNSSQKDRDPGPTRSLSVQKRGESISLARKAAAGAKLRRELAQQRQKSAASSAASAAAAAAEAAARVAAAHAAVTSFPGGSSRQGTIPASSASGAGSSLSSDERGTISGQHASGTPGSSQSGGLLVGATTTSLAAMGATVPGGAVKMPNGLSGSPCAPTGLANGGPSTPQRASTSNTSAYTTPPARSSGAFSSVGGVGAFKESASTRANVSQTKEKRAQRVKWRPGEIEALKRGVEKHGAGRWAVILREFAEHFDPVRISVDLKDKWRNLAKAPKPARGTVHAASGESAERFIAQTSSASNIAHIVASTIPTMTAAAGYVQPVISTTPTPGGLSGRPGVGLTSVSPAPAASAHAAAAPFVSPGTAAANPATQIGQRVGGPGTVGSAPQAGAGEPPLVQGSSTSAAGASSAQGAAAVAHGHASAVHVKHAAPTGDAGVQCPQAYPSAASTSHPRGSQVSASGGMIPALKGSSNCDPQATRATNEASSTQPSKEDIEQNLPVLPPLTGTGTEAATSADRNQTQPTDGSQVHRTDPDAGSAGAPSRAAASAGSMASAATNDMGQGAENPGSEGTTSAARSTFDQGGSSLAPGAETTAAASNSVGEKRPASSAGLEIDTEQAQPSKRHKVEPSIVSSKDEQKASDLSPEQSPTAPPAQRGVGENVDTAEGRPAPATVTSTLQAVRCVP